VFILELGRLTRCDSRRVSPVHQPLHGQGLRPGIAHHVELSRAYPSPRIAGGDWNLGRCFGVADTVASYSAPRPAVHRSGPGWLATQASDWGDLIRAEALAVYSM
jgi:hypothetical protein